MDDAILPAPEEYWFRPIYQPSFSLQDVNRIRPEMGDRFNNRLSAIDYSAMAAVVHGQRERLRVNCLANLSLHKVIRILCTCMSNN